MWYVIQVKSGDEEKTLKQCRKIISDDILIEGFIPRYEEMKRYQGKWHKQQSILFPGYIFLVSDDVASLYHRLEKVTSLTKILGTGDEIVPLNEREIELIQRFGKKERVVTMSKGIMVNDKVIVTEGPMVGNEGLIRKIDRHKRKVYLEVPMFGRMVEMQVGLEIVEKIEAERF